MLELDLVNRPFLSVLVILGVSLLLSAAAIGLWDGVCYLCRWARMLFRLRGDR